MGIVIVEQFLEVQVTFDHVFDPKQVKENVQDVFLVKGKDLSIKNYVGNW